MKNDNYLRISGYVALFLFVLILVFVGMGHCQVSVAIAPEVHPQFLSASGTPLSGGFLYTYLAGTSTLAPTYVDSSGTVANSNPIPLDATGSPSNGSTQTGIWLANQAYKFCAYNSTMVQQWCTDQVTGVLGFLNLANIWSSAQTFNLPLTDLATDNQMIFGAPGNQTTVDYPPPTGNITIHFPNTSGTVLTGVSPTITTPTINSGILNTPSLNVLKATNTVTQTGDTALHTIYTIPIPGGAMGISNQLKVTCSFAVGANAGAAAVLLNYGGTRISAPGSLAAGLANSSGDYLMLLGGNVGATNVQSWDTLVNPYQATTNFGAIYHQTSTIDSTTTQNLTVTYTGGANTDSITFYRCIAEIL